MEMREKVLDRIHRIFLRYRNVWGNKQSNKKVQLIRVADYVPGCALKHAAARKEDCSIIYHFLATVLLLVFAL